MTSSATRLVVVGASLAGLRAVEAARASGFDGRITLVGAEPHLPYDRPPLSKAFLTDAERSAPNLKTYEELADLDVELMLGRPASGLDTRARLVRVGDLDIGFDQLVIATGAAATRLAGTADLDGIATLRTVDDARRVRAQIQAGARLVVVGAGFIGSEIASSARYRGSAVTIVEAAPLPLVRAVGPTMGRALVDLHRRNGTDIRTGVGIRAFLGDQRVEAVVLDDGTRLDADMVVVGIGARPATEWLQHSGVSLHEQDGGVVCDEYLRTNVPGVSAAGDVAHFPNHLFGGTRMRLENWTSAAEQGAVAAWNAVGQGGLRVFETVPYFWSDWYGNRIQFVGIGNCDEVKIIHDDSDQGHLIALYRRGDRLVGALTINEPAKIMKYRRHIRSRGTWDAAQAMFAVPA